MTKLTAKMRQLRERPQASSRLKTILLTIIAIATFYLLFHRPLCRSSSPTPTHLIHQSHISATAPATTLRHLLFSIASSASSLPRRLDYIRLWYSPNSSTRALLFLDREPLIPTAGLSLPPIVISSDTSRFPYSFHRGHRSAIRVARIVKEAVDRDPDVRWFVFGDDDTIFFPDNLVEVLSKYDHRQWYYIGSVSESFEQNVKMSFEMAYGGGGFAISYPLAKALSRVLDSCLMRYPHLYGSDARIASCVSELGVGLTREPGFHQFDVRGDLFGLLAAHPLSPILSLHHLDIVEPIFPLMNRSEAVKHLFKAARVDPRRILQQTVCYDHASNVTVSVSWGYAIQVFEGNQLLPDILRSQRTFTPWRRRGINNENQYVIDTKEYPGDHCKRPVVFVLEDVASGTGRVWSRYTRYTTSSCPHAFENLKDIVIFAKNLEQDVGQVMAPRRQCCDIVHAAGKSMVIDIRQCGSHELIAMSV